MGADGGAVERERCKPAADANVKFRQGELYRELARGRHEAKQAAADVEGLRVATILIPLTTASLCA